MNEVFVVDDLAFELRRSAKRQKIGITVDHNGELVIYAPLACPVVALEQAVRKSYRWLYTKIAEKELLMHIPRTHEYRNGESFYYLGRPYRLQIVDISPQEPVVKLQQDWFLLREDAIEQAEEHFLRWYCDHGQKWMRERIELFTNYVGAVPKSLTLRDLGYRWGSCSIDETLNFHWKTMQLPPWVVDYVIVHELVHLHEPNHSKQFWLRLEEVMPDYMLRKEWLEENGGRF